MRITKFKLSSPQDCGSVSCDGFGPKVGSVRLLKRTLDDSGDEIWAPRDSEILNALLAAHYGFPIDLTGKMEGLRAVARALNKGDVTHAWFVTIFLQFPDLPSFDDQADRYSELFKSLQWSGLLKADEEWNKKHPQTGTRPNPGWFDTVPKDQKAPISTEDAGKRRWPSKEANEIVRDWAKKNPTPPRGRSPSGYLKLISELLHELSKIELNQGEDLITAQLYANYDPPKTLDELRVRPEQFSMGYERHHIVEQNDANRAKFGDAMIDDPDNIV